MTGKSRRSAGCVLTLTAGLVFLQMSWFGINTVLAENTITGIKVVGPAVKFFDHTQKTEDWCFADGTMSAWREADGTVNLLMPSPEMYRLRGPDLLHLTFDPQKIYSAKVSGTQIQENLYNYYPFILGAYSEDGVNFYGLAHTEWYAERLAGGPGSRGWVTSVNAYVSHNGGASFALNTHNGNHLVTSPGFYWTGSQAFADGVWKRTWNTFSGLQQITGIFKEGAYYYALGNLYHRDFTRIDPGTGEPAMDKEGVVIIRTTDFTKPDGWTVWIGGGNYSPISTTPVLNWGTFYPKQGGVSYASWNQSLIYDTNAQCWICVFFNKSLNRLCYMTSKTLASPVWSDYAAIAGVPQVDPIAFWPYATIMDPTCTGYNFGSTGSGSPYLFWSNDGPLVDGHHLMTNRSDLCYAQLSITYSTPLPGTVAAPTLNPSRGNYSSAVSVTLNCATSGAMIHYTTNGNAPTASSPAYGGPLTISTTTTVKALATKAGMSNSVIASGTYTIGGN